MRGVPQTKDSFWANTSKLDDGCLVWVGAIGKHGYGVTSWGGKSYRAHRVAAWLSGVIDALNSKHSVCHSCDNPICCEPKHLFAGDQKLNMQDKFIKGRTPKGQNHGMAKLKSHQVLEIRNLYATKQYSQVDIAKKYGVTKHAVWRVIHNKTWN